MSSGGQGPTTDNAGDADDEQRLAAALSGDVRAVLRAIQGSAVEEIRLERGGTRIALRRAWQPAAPGSETPAAAAAPAMDTPPVPETAAEVHVFAPMVGVFHHSREPDGPPLAVAGEPVENGRPLGVIETLGIAGDVEAAAAGTLVFLLEDGLPVEYGQIVATISPA